MRTLSLILAMLVTAAGARAQDADALAVTLPTGRVVHFQTMEQKARFEAAQSRLRSAAAAPQDPADQPKPAASNLGHASLDQQPQVAGKVNVSAPTFSADYYMGAPETWVGKQIVLSVAYLRPEQEGTQKDGLREFYASTWGNIAAGSDQNSGGGLTVLAPPEVAMRLLQLCGTQLLWNGGRYKTTLIKGEVIAYNQKGAINAGKKGFALKVEK